MECTEEEFNRLDIRLQELADESYRKFHGKLIPNVDTVFYGVRVPTLRKLAKELIRQDWRGFVGLACGCGIYEMNMLCGMVIALAKCDFSEKLRYMSRFIPCIDNWAVCDIVCGDMKDVKKHPEQMREFIEPYLSSDSEYEVRFAVVILMQYFISEEYMDDLFECFDRIRHDGYYVKMAVAWAVSVCFVKQRQATISYLSACNLDDFTYNKSIQKMIESFRVSEEDKNLLRGMRRGKGEGNEAGAKGHI